ncbi:hypothetical protein I302_108502 [Kwoniella bestiolae CBS 10118]|uniref:Protein CPL1-like domain-containing protein n=1 Tax=Kwoniella bestiolae CBS 10118 TaxID=1296100 RepID=A0A1B9FVK7_9TREE|nr:hypothetical protein I302_07122 [Kwoniella bestiolae CBS 10118]OCF22781.1 hypothetical protein I302_07122 [Kwoniella bestiolae CBS 10118]
MLSTPCFLLYSVLAISLPWKVLAQSAGNPAFVGCVDDQYFPDDSFDVGSFDDPISCAQFCFGVPEQFRYSTWTLVPQDINRCYCSNTFPASGEIQPGTDADGGCDANTQSYIHITSSTFNLVGCRSTQSSSFEVIVSSPQQCLASCMNTGYSFLSPQSDGYHCSCGEIADLGPQSVNCGPEVWSSFEHTSGDFVANAPSGFVKRQKIRQRRLESQNLYEFCPAGLRACSVPGDERAFECLSVDSELESCGGCMYGDYGVGARTDTLGVDCTSLPGVAMGAVTCSSGLCTAFACEEGFELSLNSTCVSLF